MGIRWSGWPRRIERNLFTRRPATSNFAISARSRCFEIEQIDCTIGIWADENTKALTQLRPQKDRHRSQAARKPYMEIFLQRAAEGKLHWTGTQYPTQASAQDAEMSLSEYEDFVFNAGLLDRARPGRRVEAAQRAPAAADRFPQRQKRLSRHRRQRHRRSHERRRPTAGSTATGTKISPTAKSSPAPCSTASMARSTSASPPFIMAGRCRM